MALRSLAGTLGGRLVRWASASRDAPRPTADPNLDILGALRSETSVEGKVLAVRKVLREETRLYEEEFKRRIWKHYRDIVIIAAVGIFSSAFIIASEEAFVEFMNAKEEAKEEGKTVDAKEFKTMDKEQV